MGTSVKEAIKGVDMQSQTRKVTLEVHSARNPLTSERAVLKSYRRYNSMENLKSLPELNNILESSPPNSNLP